MNDVPPPRADDTAGGGSTELAALLTLTITDLGEVAGARERIRVSLGDTPLLDDALLVATELVTNAVRHTAEGRAVLRIGPASDGLSVRIAVDDCDPRPVAIGTMPDPGATSGRGLAIVGLLAARCGVSPIAGGKTVWAELRPGPPR